MIGERLIDRETIESVIEDLAARVDADLEGKTPVFICVLKGAVFFFTALTSRLSRSVVVDFIQVSSYGASTESSGTVVLIKDLSVSIAGKDVYIVEDIVDSGLTLVDVVELVRARHPRSVKIVSLLSKPARRKIDIDIDFVGLEIEDRFVVGFGLDFDEHFRNLPAIWEFLPEQEER